ncbi:MAG TPA: MEDS domain-containing protein [Propionibacteriaceae bacterium]
MTVLAPVRNRQSYRHEAFFWRDAADFSDAMVRFVKDGLAEDEAVMVALVPAHAEWIRDGLGREADLVTFVDMAELGRNPARIIPAWQQFLSCHSGYGRPARGIGEPIWFGRRPEEVSECQLHEALLNVALKADTPFWLVCPYNEQRLDPSIIEEAHRSHHAILESESYRGSTRYGGRAHIDALFAAELPQLSGGAARYIVTAQNLYDVFAFVTREAYAADLWSHQALNLAAAARHVASDSLLRGADRAEVRIWNDPSAVICEVTDSTAVTDVLAGRHVPAGDHDRGLWAANQICDLVQLRSTPSKTTVRLFAWK